ncbi:MAG: VTT domain-containing protein [Parvibaculum sp.]
MTIEQTAAEGPAENGGQARILRPGRNVWRIDEASRARLLIDAAEYYGALRRAMRCAEHSLLIVGWDIDSRTPLVGPQGSAEDGMPETLGAFLTALAEEKPNLAIKLLLWDYSVLYAKERELLPAMQFRWTSLGNVDLCLDNEIPLGGSHHQKLVVIDDSLAFCGGLDLTIRRWDTSDHAPDNPHRVDPQQEPYRPFHDVQMMVDGAPAAALGDLVRRRWRRAASEKLKPPPPAGDRWPEGVDPHFSNVAVGIARTEPPYKGDNGTREVEALFADMLARAQRWVYIENQFLTCTEIARQLAGRLREKPELEALLVVPQSHRKWLEHRTMLVGRLRFMDVLRRAGIEDRVRVLTPSVGAGDDATGIMVHSKLAIVDDVLLRVGSANLCNRSMGLDTECDLAVEAESAEDREAVMAVLGRLLGEHCGAEPREVVAALRDTGSLFEALDRCGGTDRALVPIEDDEAEIRDNVTAIEALADPVRPPVPDGYLASIVEMPGTGHRRRNLPTLMKGVAVLLLIVGLGLLWRYTPLSEMAEPEKMRNSFGSIAAAPLAPFIVVGLYVLTGFVAFPLVLLIAVTAATFGLWPGILYASLGAMSSALANYAAGRYLGSGMLRNLLGPRVSRVAKAVNDRGIVALTAVRLVPVAPFLLVNLVAGALRIRVLDYTVGTALGLAPGIVLMSVLGDRLFTMLEDPSLVDLAIVLGAFVLWIALALGLQRLISKRRKPE